MSDQKAILVVTAKVNKEKMEDLKTYLGQAGPMTMTYGGQPVAKYKTIAEIAGEESPELISITEFPSVKVINEMVNSKDFTDLDDLRASAFTKLNMMICE